MKILILNSKEDFRIISFISPFQHIAEVGMMKEFNQDAYNEFNASIVLSDDMSKTPGAYDLTKIGLLKPFINLDMFRETSIQPKYQSDVSYIGHITDMDNVLLELYKSGHNVRYFCKDTSGFGCYSGDINMSECFNIYKNAKVSPVPKNDLGYRELDIIVSGGNPLKYKDKVGFTKECIKGINGKKFSTQYSKTEILQRHTNYDRVAEELSKIGASLLSTKILARKQICLGL